MNDDLVKGRREPTPTVLIQQPKLHELFCIRINIFVITSKLFRQLSSI